jgi:hypothetical protein
MTMASTTPPEQSLLDQALDRLRGILPDYWQVAREDPGPAGVQGSSPNAFVHISAESQMGQLLVEARQRFAPRDVDTVLGGHAELIRRAAGNVPVMVVAPWFSPRSRELLMKAGMNYLDLAGNVRIALRYPSLFVERVSPAPGPRTRQSTMSLRGVKAGRVVRLLADVIPPYGILDLAAAAGVTPGYMSRLIDMLDREALVERTRRGGVTDVDWPELLRRRVESYSVLETNEASRWACPNGAAFAWELAHDVRPPILATGSFAAEQIVHVAQPTLLLMYAMGDVEEFVRYANLIPADEGANVILLTPYDEVISQRTSAWLTGELPPIRPVAACSQLVLDCLSGPGRMPAEGEALLTWMAENQSRWRLPSLDSLRGSATTP